MTALRSFLCVLLLIAFAKAGVAQEFNATISVNAPALQTVDPVIFQSLERDLTEFINNTKWTDRELDPEERIRINLQFTISTELSPTSFRAELAMQATRPVYGSSYQTPLFTYLDKDVSFTYQQFQPIEYIENVYNDQLSSTLSFYIYVILGLDADTFSPFGGENYFQKAQDIYNTLPQGAVSGNDGWDPKSGNRNRFWLIENLLTPRMRPFRRALYDYHRQGLDLMHDDAAVGRAVMASAIQDIGKANEAYPNSMIVQVYSQSKTMEILNVFAQGTRQEKDKVSQVMMKIDPTRANEYRRLNF